MNVDQLRAHAQVRRMMVVAMDALANALRDRLPDDWSAVLDYAEEEYAPNPYEVGGVVGLMDIDICLSNKGWAWTVIVEVHHSAEGDWSNKYRLYTGAADADEMPVFDHAIDVVKAGIERRQGASQ